MTKIRYILLPILLGLLSLYIGIYANNFGLPIFESILIVFAFFYIQLKTQYTIIGKVRNNNQTYSKYQVKLKSLFSKSDFSDYDIALYLQEFRKDIILDRIHNYYNQMGVSINRDKLINLLKKKPKNLIIKGTKKDLKSETIILIQKYKSDFYPFKYVKDMITSNYLSNSNLTNILTYILTVFYTIFTISEYDLIENYFSKNNAWVFVFMFIFMFLISQLITLVPELLSKDYLFRLKIDYEIIEEVLSKYKNERDIIMNKEKLEIARLEIIKRFNEIKNQWIETHWDNDNMLGNEFEEQLGVDENNNSRADYKGIELKTQRSSSKAMITLFSKSPLETENSNSKLRELFGYPDSILSTSNRLSVSVTHKGAVSRKANRIFKIDLDDDTQTMSLRISKSLTDKTYEDFKQTWSYETFHESVKHKLNTIAFIQGEEKREDNTRYVKFTQLEMITDFTVERILQAIRDNRLKIDIRLGVYKSGKNIGKHHDHGTGFRISLKHLREFANFEVIS